MNKSKMLKIILVVLLIVVIFVTVIFAINKNKEKEVSNTNDIVDTSAIKALPEEIPLEYAINEGDFVITIDKIYNKDVLDRFIKNTAEDVNNRVEDKIRIVTYNYDGYPNVYDLEYKNNGYILISDATRNNIMQRDITVNNDIPGKYYKITLTEDLGIFAAIISLSVTDDTDPGASKYEDIEIARYAIP